MAVWFCLICAFFGFFLFDGANTLFFLLFPQTAQRLIEGWGPLLRAIDCALLLAAAGLAVFWLTPVVFALCGSMRPVPLQTQLARRPWVLRFSFLFNSLLLASVPVIAAFAVHASTLTRTSRDSAAVYFLYDEGMAVPRWAFALGMYRMTLQADRNWGEASTVVDRLNRDTLRSALANGRVVILATHGEMGCAITYYAPEYLCVTAPDMAATDENGSRRFLRMKLLQADNHWGRWENVTANPNLKLAYLFACNGGTRAAQWEEHLSPAQVITYNRISTIYDHAWWFAIAGPKLLEKM